jgi:hypothetical protein
MTTRIGDRGAVVAGVLLALFDTLWGVVLSGWFDWSRPHEAWLAVGFLLGLPAYVLDGWRSGRTLLFLPAVVLTRWLAEAYEGPHFAPVPPWSGNLLLLAAAGLLQWAKWRHGGSVGRQA